MAEETPLNSVADAADVPGGDTPEVADVSMRDTIEAAFDETTEQDAPVKESASETEGQAQENKQGLERDERGKFKKGEVKTPAKPDQQANGIPQETAPKLKAPGSWKAGVRDKFNALDPDVQNEIMRREREISTGFNEINDIKKFRDSFQNSMGQFSHVINAEGGRPLETIHNLMTTANVLYTGTPMQKAQTVGAIIKNFGISVEMLDDLLSGNAQGQAYQQPQSQQPDLSHLVQSQVNQALAPWLQQQAQQQAQLDKEVVSELDAFMADPANEFVNDVADTMADLLDASAKRGQKMDLQTAYSRAILAHNDIAELVEQRKQQSQQQMSAAKVAAAKRKAISIKGSPTPAPPIGTGDLRDTIAAAMEQHSS